MTDDDLKCVLARLQRLEDREAIRDTWLDYCNRLDSEDWNGLGDVFTEDGVLEMVGLNALVPGIDGVYRGRGDIIDTYQHRLLRESDRWRFAFLRISVRYRTRLAADHVSGQSLQDILAKPYSAEL